MKREDIDRYTQSYQNNIIRYDIFSRKLKDLLNSILDNSKIPYHTIECRTKSIESFKEKLSRDGKNYNNPLVEITDFSGIRIILYYQKDVDAVVEILRKEFKVYDELSVDKRKILKENEFGYLSVHLIASINKKRSSLTEWNNLKDLKAEIQVRTVLQHSWASISHILVYKRENDIPTQFKRKLNRLAGLLELADEEFEDLKKEQQLLQNEISDSIEKNNFELPINILTVEDYLNKININKDIENELAGRDDIVVESFQENEDDINMDFGVTIKEVVSQIVIILTYFNVSTIKQFDEILLINKSHISTFFYQLMKINDGNIGGDTYTLFAVFLIGLLSKNEDDVIELYKKLGWHENFVLKRLIGYKRNANRPK